MSLAKDVRQREVDKFVDTTSGQTAVATVQYNQSADGSGSVPVVATPDITNGIFDPPGNKPTYVGFNESVSALTSDTDWYIYKFTYSGNSVSSYKQKTGAWDDRATLF